MIIDSHQHFWQYEPVKHSWIDDEMAIIRKDFMPVDLQKVYQENNIDGCIAVQADQTITETDFLIDLATKNNFIKGVVGWIDLRDQNVDEVLKHYSQFPILKGFRHVVQGETDVNFLLRDNFLKGISLLEKYNFTYDILVFPHQLGAVLEFVKKFPNQKFVIDHIAKPYIKDGFFDGWANLMTAIGQQQNVFCKLSGIVTEADYKNWTTKEIKPYLATIFKAFGTKRLMFGSDWPVCLVAGNYEQIKKLITNFIADLPQQEQEAILSKNAIEFYNIK